MIDKSISFSDKVNASKQDKIQSEMITVYGEVELSPQEKSFLALGPKFPLMETLNNEQIERDFLTALTKIRWSRTGMESDEVTRYKTEEEQKEEEDMEEEVHLNTRVYDEVRRTLDLSKRICTDQKGNRRVFMPRARPIKEECNLRTRKNAWKTEWTKYLLTETRGKGSQDHHQLTPDEIAGRTSLLKRIADGEIHVSESDKGKKVVVMDLQMYHDMSIVHTSGLEDLGGDTEGPKGSL